MYIPVALHISHHCSVLAIFQVWQKISRNLLVDFCVDDCVVIHNCLTLATTKFCLKVADMRRIEGT